MCLQAGEGPDHRAHGAAARRLDAPGRGAPGGHADPQARCCQAYLPWDAAGFMCQRRGRCSTAGGASRQSATGRRRGRRQGPPLPPPLSAGLQTHYISISKVHYLVCRGACHIMAQQQSSYHTQQGHRVCCRYGVGQKYGAHFDSLVEQSPRIATVLIYLQVSWVHLH